DLRPALGKLLLDDLRRQPESRRDTVDDHYLPAKQFRRYGQVFPETARIRFPACSYPEHPAERVSQHFLPPFFPYQPYVAPALPDEHGEFRERDVHGFRGFDAGFAFCVEPCNGERHDDPVVAVPVYPASPELTFPDNE